MTEASDSEKKVSADDAKAAKIARKERNLKWALAVVLVVLVYQIFHWFAVVQQVKDPNNPDARPEAPRRYSEAELEESEKLVAPKAAPTPRGASSAR